MPDNQKSGAEEEYGPKITELLHQLATAINQETGAMGVAIDCKYRCFMGMDNLEMKIGVSPDANKGRAADQSDKADASKFKVDDTLDGILANRKSDDNTKGEDK